MSAQLHKYWHSLRFRYSISGLLLAILIIVSANLTYLTITRVQKETSSQLQTLQLLSEQTHQIHVNLLDGYTYINAYLLEPGHKEYKQQALHSVETAVQLSQKMQQDNTQHLSAYNKKIQQLFILLSELKLQTDKLFLTRENTDKQYPSMAVGNNVMQPNRDSFNNAIAIAINELNEEKVYKKNPGLYAEFIRTRQLWSQMLSNFRLYLANRVGSFNEAALMTQERGIVTLNDELGKQLKKLSAFDEQGKLGFQAGAAVVDMIETSSNWFNGFKRVMAIHHADGWRVDSKIMKEDIVPRVEKISILVSELENSISKKTSGNVDVLAGAVQKQSKVLILAAVTVIGFLVVIFISTQRLVFRPIAVVVEALKKESLGKEITTLPKVRSVETAALINAFREMSKRIYQRQTELEHQALHDDLTSLPNRTLLQDRISQHIQVARREHSSLSLLMIDLDRFKEINDTLGHHIGDRVLIEVGARIESLLREVDTVARLGGDEFAVVLPGTDKDQAVKVCHKILNAMHELLKVDELHLYIGMSIGVACFPEHGTDVTTLIQHADVAMYVAKNNQQGCSTYDAKEDVYSRGRLELISELREAVSRNELTLQYQPVIDLQTESVRGVESLLRWQHPVYGMIPPDQVVELAEQTGLINSISYWVLNKAIEDGKHLQDKGYELDISINISVYNLRDIDFVRRVEAIIAEHQFPFTKVVLEITESAMMSNPVHATEILNKLDKMGVKLVVDDFGTGFSSLAYLKQLPVDELKIDKSFVLGMKNNKSDEVIVHSTIELAHNLGMKVVAEGVETELMYNQLKKYHADNAQGYYMCRPLTMDKLLEWLDKSYRKIA